ncbi:hypothetical protein, partial [Amycolatopsis circi]|uniref:hypothetical protein n=1 Tax=Amycolatopsis circi TaxID=871959 RepID=UPI001AC0000A
MHTGCDCRGGQHPAGNVLGGRTLPGGGDRAERSVDLDGAGEGRRCCCFRCGLDGVELIGAGLD